MNFQLMDVTMLHLLDFVGFLSVFSVKLSLLLCRHLVCGLWSFVCCLTVEEDLNIFGSGFGLLGLRDPAAISNIPIVSNLLKEGLSDLLNAEVLGRILKIEVDFEWGVYCLRKLPHIIEVGIG